MKAYVWTGPRQFEEQHVERPEAGPGKSCYGFSTQVSAARNYQGTSDKIAYENRLWSWVMSSRGKSLHWETDWMFDTQGCTRATSWR